MDESDRDLLASLLRGEPIVKVLFPLSGMISLIEMRDAAKKSPSIDNAIRLHLLYLLTTLPQSTACNLKHPLKNRPAISQTATMLKEHGLIDRPERAVPA